MTILSVLLAAVLAPLLPGIVNQTKAFFAGRRGPGFFRLYCDLAKLLRKSCVRPAASTWVFDLAQPVSLAAVLTAAAVFPWTGTGGAGGLVPAVAFFYLLAAGRLATVLGALDAGNAFEGMGASRDVQFAALAEPIVLILLGFLTLHGGGVSVGDVLSGVAPSMWRARVIPLVLAVLAFSAVFLLENCRVPFDDPETHLELTMIHEAMLLDVGGPDLACALYAAALKFELLAAFLVSLVLPSALSGWGRLAAVFGAVAFVAIATGVVESAMARVRFVKTPQILLGAVIIAALAVLFFFRF